MTPMTMGYEDFQPLSPGLAWFACHWRQDALLLLIIQRFHAFSREVIKLPTARRRTQRGGASVSKLITSILCVWIVLLAPLLSGCSDSQPSHATAPTFLSPSSLTDKQALIALYNTTDGPNWNYSDYWLTGAANLSMGKRHRRRRGPRHPAGPHLESFEVDGFYRSCATSPAWNCWNSLAIA